MHSFCKEVEYVKVTPSRGPSNQTLHSYGSNVEVKVVGVVIAVAVGVVEGSAGVVVDNGVMTDNGSITLMRTQPTLSYSRTLSPPSAPP